MCTGRLPCTDYYGDKDMVLICRNDGAEDDDVDDGHGDDYAAAAV